MIRTAFVTGATGLLGNNLVRALVARGVNVRALVRSASKARVQFSDLPPDRLEIVEGEMTDVGRFRSHLAGCDVLFHTAAHFRDSYKGGRHWDELYRINVEGTARLMTAAYGASIRRMVHTSSVAVLNGPRGALIDETMTRLEADGDDYYRSKILSDKEVLNFLDQHPDMWACLVLPGWMFGPGDLGPTSSGQLVQDFLARKLPGVPPGSFSVVDARDVAAAMIAAADRGRRGERYIASGRHLTMRELLPLLERASGVKAPTRSIPAALLYAMAGFFELSARLTGKPVLISLAAVRLMTREQDRTRFSNAKSERELGVTFRPVDETLRDVVSGGPGRDAARSRSDAAA